MSKKKKKPRKKKKLNGKSRKERQEKRNIILRLEEEIKEKNILIYELEKNSIDVAFFWEKSKLEFHDIKIDYRNGRITQKRYIELLEDRLFLADKEITKLKNSPKRED